MQIVALVAFLICCLLSNAHSLTMVDHGPVGATSAFTPQWVWATGTIPTSGDSSSILTSAYHNGAYLVAPTGSTKITKIRSYWEDETNSNTITMCVYNTGGGSSLGGGTGTVPGTSTGFYACETGTLNISTTAGNTYWLLVSPSDWVLEYWRAGIGNGYYTEDDYTGACDSVGTEITNTNVVAGVGAYFE